MKRSIQLVALLLTVFMGSCTGGKDKAAAEHVDAKPIVKLADVKVFLMPCERESTVLFSRINSAGNG